METWEIVLTFIAAMAAVLILITVALNFFKINNSQEKIKIEGRKGYVVSSVVNLIYKCFEENRERNESVICSQLIVKSTEDIASTDILNYIDTSRIDTSSLRVGDLGVSAEIIIRYENQIIYVEKVENERIGT